LEFHPKVQVASGAVNRRITIRPPPSSPMRKDRYVGLKNASYIDIDDTDPEHTICGSPSTTLTAR
jgi:hypothetical protein